MTPGTTMDPADAFQELLHSVGINNDHDLMERSFAISIDGHDWSDQVRSMRLGSDMRTGTAGELSVIRCL